MIKTDEKTLTVRLKAPLNFDENKLDQVTLQLQMDSGETLEVLLQEEGKYAKYLSGTVQLKRRKLKHGNQTSKRTKNMTITASYGLGYFEKKTMMKLE